MQSYQCIATLQVSGQPLGLDYSASGKLIALATGGNSAGLILIDSDERCVKTSSKNSTSMNFCVHISPADNDVIATGGNDSRVTLWNKGQPYGTLTNHKGWIWCVCFTQDGSKLLSCSSDR